VSIELPRGTNYFPIIEFIQIVKEWKEERFITWSRFVRRWSKPSQNRGTTK
jgi:hypothetical protein